MKYLNFLFYALFVLIIFSAIAAVTIYTLYVTYETIVYVFQNHKDKQAYIVLSVCLAYFILFGVAVIEIKQNRTTTDAQ